MADVSYTDTATVRRTYGSTVLGKGDAGSPKHVTSTVEVSTGSTGATYKFARVPSDARISGLSTLYWDSLSTGSTLDLDFGLASVDSNITSDPDALNDGLDGSSTGTSALVKDRADYGKRAWEYVNGQTADPGGELDIYMTSTTDSIDSVGTVTLDLVYTLD